MDYSAGGAVVAGLVGAGVMVVILYVGIAMMPTQMTMNLLYMLGTMMTRSRGTAYIIGAMIHAMMGVIFALIHTGLYQAFGLESALAAWGVLFGLVHWVVVGMGMGMIGTMHPLMRSGELQAPGAFVKNHPMMTVMGFLMLHLLYGLVVALVYDAYV